jgi:hypothetical protein
MRREAKEASLRMRFIEWQPRCEVRHPPARKRFAALFLIALTAIIASASQDTAHAQDFQRIPIAYLSQAVETPPNLSNLELPPADEGVRGGQVAIEDNNTTGRFLK